MFLQLKPYSLYTKNSDSRQLLSKLNMKGRIAYKINPKLCIPLEHISPHNTLGSDPSRSDKSSTDSAPAQSKFYKSNHRSGRFLCQSQSRSPQGKHSSFRKKKALICTSNSVYLKAQSKSHKFHDSSNNKNLGSYKFPQDIHMILD